MPALVRSNGFRYLKEVGFEGSMSGGKHQFMTMAEVTLRLPNPHRSDVGKEPLVRNLRQAGIDRKTWEML